MCAVDFISVAVSGLPTPCNDHAVKMVRFARDCLSKMRSLSNKLEVMLGPDTSELGIRIGLHSGPVTGGVLRGQRSRFQLFGDTVNTASRMGKCSINGELGRPSRILLQVFSRCGPKRFLSILLGRRSNSN